jgi:hypothetical protein
LRIFETPARAKFAEGTAAFGRIRMDLLAITIRARKVQYSRA